MKTTSQLKLLMGAALVATLPASAAGLLGGAGHLGGQLNGAMMSRGNMSGITVVDPAIRGTVASTMRAQSQERAAANGVANNAAAANSGQGSAISSVATSGGGSAQGSTISSMAMSATGAGHRAAPSSAATSSQSAAAATPTADAARADHAAFAASRVAAGKAHRQGN